ncbi:Protein STRUBBELIG-REPTOR FAMILY 3 [Dionaea muscipula]
MGALQLLDVKKHDQWSSCSEHAQRLLIYEYCSNGSLQDSLHLDEDYKRKVLWNNHIRIAFGAARALEYLHEVCQPPVIHRNFKATNILLNDEFNARVFDCGLAPLIASGFFYSWVMSMCFAEYFDAVVVETSSRTLGDHDLGLAICTL